MNSIACLIQIKIFNDFVRSGKDFGIIHVRDEKNTISKLKKHFFFHKMLLHKKNKT